MSLDTLSSLEIIDTDYENKKIDFKLIYLMIRNTYWIQALGIKASPIFFAIAIAIY